MTTLRGENVSQSAVEAADITAITQLILRERESRDLARWETMRECFWADSLVRVSWFRGNGKDFVTGSIDMARRGIPAKHRWRPSSCGLPATVRSRDARLIDLPVTLKGVGATLSTDSRFLYRVEKRDGRWGLMGFDAVYMRDELIPDLPGQTIAIDPTEVKAFRKSYRCCPITCTARDIKLIRICLEKIAPKRRRCCIRNYLPGPAWMFPSDCF